MDSEYTQSLLHSLPERAQRFSKEHQKYLKRLRERNPKKLDSIFDRIHHEVFEDIDCLACGNCCSTISPRWMERDIVTAAKFCDMHPKTFKLTYLGLDEDDDFICKKTPCPFLEDDKKCFIYEARPKACREYPHTCSKNMRGLLTIARKNIFICPAVFEIVERVREEIPL